MNNLFKLLACPACHKSLTFHKDFCSCNNCSKKYPIADGIPNFSLSMEDNDLKLSQKKWDEKYKKDSKKEIVKELDFLEKKFFSLTWNQLIKHVSLRPHSIFLEIGCGTFYLGRALAKKGYIIVGIDMSMEALKLAQMAFEQEGIKNYLLVCGNILNMPFKKNVVDLVYGAGVIEHFKDTLKSVKEIYRVLKNDGISYNTVPYLNLGSLTYRQIWGNIPRLPILENIYTFFHTKILGAKHMRFGYELAFNQSYLKKIHAEAGFYEAKTGKFECRLDFDYLKINFLKKVAVYLAENSQLFWPMIYVSAKK